MYDNFVAKDRWSKKDVRCEYQALIVAIATRHADAVDVKFKVGERSVWIALPCAAWAEYKNRTGKVVTDPLAIQVAGHFLKTIIESGLESGREMYTLTVEEMLKEMDAVLAEYGAPRAALVTT